MNPHDFEVHQEEDAVAVSRVMRVGVAAVVIGAIGVFFAGLSLALRVGELKPSFAGPHGPQPAPSELSEVEQTPIWDTRRGEDLEAEQRHELDRWGWADRDAGVARIPIDRAMDLVVRESR
jgi:hypothetical protein